jgi:hydroxymethylglutaryl-CoA synthase
LTGFLKENAYPKEKVIPENIVSPEEKVGIDDLSIYVPALFLSAAGEFSDLRGIDSAKLTKGIGIERMAIPDAHEDAATMAAMSLLELMQRNDLTPKEIGKIYIGTESGVDEAKAIGTYVIGMMEKIFGKGAFQDCCTVEFKSACIATTLALESMSFWAAAEEDDLVGVVIASDIAKYPLRSPGEYTQGAGSVSLLIKRRPRLISLEGNYGFFTRDENDFFRPLGACNAVVNGKHSNQCYLDAVQGAFDAFAKRSRKRGLIIPETGECITDYVSHLIFHIPYPRMAEYAASAIFRHEWRGLPRWNAIEAEIGEEPKVGAYTHVDDFLAAEADFMKRFARSNPFLEAFKSKVKETTMISCQVGNIYTGSIYLGLASLIEQQKLKPGERVCFGAYGSGCSALVFSGLVQREASLIPLRDIEKKLNDRTQISLEEYEKLHEGKMERSLLPPSQEFALVGIDRQGYRHYDYVE